MPESSKVGKTTGWVCRVVHLSISTTFSVKRTSLVMLSWNVISRGSIAGSPPAGKILTCLFPFLMFLLNLCLPLKTDSNSPKLEKVSLTAWSLMSSGRKIVFKIGSFPFLRGPTRFWKFRHISELLKRRWISVPASFSFAVFDPKIKTNFEGETLYRAPISVTPSDFRTENIRF